MIRVQTKLLLRQGYLKHEEIIVLFGVFRFPICLLDFRYLMSHRHSYF